LGEARHRGVLEALRVAAQACRAARRPFFAVLVDPEARLALPSLYHERATREPAGGHPPRTPSAGS
ncbi:MAG TPA: hypothetical protein VLC53_11920, partial [Myxococcota bacterium]|nr:hypothetical protein [Myxococcota bacterium]